MRIVNARKRRAPEFDPDRPPGPGWVIAELVLLAGILVLAAYDYRKLTDNLWRLGRARYAQGFAEPEVQFSAATGWLGPPEVRAIREAGLAVAGRDFLDPELPQKMAECYAANPWVARVEFVRRLSGGRMQVELTLREPAGLLVWQGQPQVIDREGVRLPKDPADLDAAGLPQITGFPADARPEPGRPWAGAERLIAALNVWAAAQAALKALPAEALAPRFRLAGIEFGPPPAGLPEPEERDPGDVVLVAAGGTRVYWGAYSAPGEEPYGGFTTAEKQAGLCRVLRQLSQTNERVAYVRLDRDQTPWRALPEERRIPPDTRRPRP